MRRRRHAHGHADASAFCAAHYVDAAICGALPASIPRTERHLSSNPFEDAHFSTDEPLFRCEYGGWAKHQAEVRQRSYQRHERYRRVGSFQRARDSGPYLEQRQRRTRRRRLLSHFYSGKWWGTSVGVCHAKKRPLRSFRWHNICSQQLPHHVDVHHIQQSIRSQRWRGLSQELGGPFRFNDLRRE